MINFYTNRSGGAIVHKIAIMLNEIDIPFTMISLDMHSEGKQIDELLKINPNRKVPAISDDETGVFLFESDAILYYLAEKTKKLLPESLVQRSEVMKWLIFEAANLSPMMLELYHFEITAPDEMADTHMNHYKENVARCCSVLNSQLENREYLCDEYSIADIAIYCWSVLLADLAEMNMDDYPNLQRWIKTVDNRAAVLATN